MKGKRDSSEIVTDILKVARNGARKTRIVYDANLNFAVIKKYLRSLEESGLLTQSNKIFRTTKRGTEYINRFEELGRVWRL